jgi:predicted component of type VI protein secretion system
MTEVMPQFIQVKLDRAKKETTDEVTAKVTQEVTKETTEKVTRDHLLNILNTTNLTPDGAMDLLGIPEADRPMYKELLKKK